MVSLPGGDAIALRAMAASTGLPAHPVSRLLDGNGHESPRPSGRVALTRDAPNPGGGRQLLYHSSDDRLNRAGALERVEIQLRREGESPIDESPEHLSPLGDVRAQEPTPVHEVPVETTRDLARIHLRTGTASRGKRHLDLLSSALLDLQGLQLRT